ncbi:MAG: NAD(+)/NADH kinase [Synergistaceae bacterium]|jgi:NAD+ kinase|nr:NAD(+)/NADH kinase [Synergistaceae bacterium]
MRKRIVGMFFRRDRKLNTEIADKVMSAGYGDAKVEFMLGEEGADDTYVPPTERWGDFRRMEFAVSIGGDGTFLRAARTVRDLGTPLYGINAGRLGFLVSGKPENAVQDVKRILSGQYDLSTRSAIRCELLRRGVTAGEFCALNEIVISKGPLSHPIDLSVSAGGETLYRLLADGIIISTPTGSTAYSLSAGGPVIHPDVKCILLAPICPHSLYARPVVMAENEVIEISLSGESGEMFLSRDGLINMRLRKGDSARISLDDRGISMIKLDRSSYYNVLRKKLGWGRSSNYVKDETEHQNQL